MRVLVVLSNNGFVRNYMSTDAFQSVEANHKVFYLASEKVSPCKKLWNKPHFEGQYYFPPELASQHFALFNVLMWRNRALSPSFQFRFKRLLHWELLRYRKGYIRQLKRFAVAYMHKETSPLYAMVGRPGEIPVAEQLRDSVLRSRPDLIIYPSSAYDPEGNDIARIGKEHSIPTLFLVDNWDNLSSKTVFWARPDHLGVWGQQSLEQAMQIHGFSADQVTLLGTPRFDEYYSDAPVSPFPFPYVLFVGQAIPFDELTTLREIETELRRKDHGFKVIYRPHPWRQARLCDDRFKQRDFQHVILDPQLVDSYNSRADIQPDLKYYPALLKNARFVIATPTTMLIEALICHKHVVLIGYDDGIHLTSPRNSLRYYEHFRGIINVGQVHVCDSKERLGLMLKGRYDTNGGADLSYYLFNDGRKYRERLSDLVKVLSKVGA